MKTRKSQSKAAAMGSASEGKKSQVSVLIESGVESSVANDLCSRLSAGSAPDDKFAAAAIQSFLDTVASFTQSGCQLQRIC